MADGGKTGINNEELVADDDAERSVASVEDQLRKEMTVYEVCFVYIICSFFQISSITILSRWNQKPLH